MKHPYLSDAACIQRLVFEWRNYGKIAIAYDFDNCVFDYHSKGHDYSEVIDLLRKAHSMGAYLIVFTAEEDKDKVGGYLISNDIPFDAINENPPFFKSDARKIYYNTLLDDRAGLWSAFYQLTEVLNIIANKI